MADIAGGSWSRRVERPGGAGAAMTADAFNPMADLPDVAGDAAAEDRAAAAEHRAAAPSGAARTRRSETVLVVEDEPRLCAFIAGALRGEGYTVLDASNGEDALRIVRGHAGPIHLLLTDVIMPGLNGRELSEIVLAIRRNVQVLFMSGSPDDALLRHGIEAASARLLLKPFSLEALNAAIRDALQRSAE